MTDLARVAVVCELPPRMEEARQVAQTLHLPFSVPADVYLILTADNQWGLKQSGGSAVVVDFNPLAWRQAISMREPLIRACRPGQGRLIVDLTAGFARDAAILAALGTQMHLVERDSIMQVLLADGLQRAEDSHELAVGQVSLMRMDAMAYLKQTTIVPDVIYYDPMHPARVKSAKVNQALQCLQTWMQPELAPEQVLDAARAIAKERVVLKFPAKAPIIGKPNHQFIGKTIRYDVYS